MGPYLRRRYREHHRLTIAFEIAKCATLAGELPPSVPLGGERSSQLAELGVVRHLGGLAFDHYVDAPVPAIAASDQYYMRVGAQVSELLFLGSGVETDRTVDPHRHQRSHMRPSVGPHSADPEQLSGLEDPGGLLPSDHDRSGIAVLVQGCLRAAHQCSNLPSLPRSAGQRAAPRRVGLTDGAEIIGLVSIPLKLAATEPAPDSWERRACSRPRASALTVGRKMSGLPHLRQVLRSANRPQI